MELLPDFLKEYPQFLLNNPIALQKTYSKFRDSPNTTTERPDLLKAVKAAERDGLELLGDLFDWLDGLEPHSMTGIVSLHENSQAIKGQVTDVLAQMVQAATMEASIEEQMEKVQRAPAVSFSLCLHLSFESYAHWTKNVEVCSKKPLNTPTWKQQRIPYSSYLCNAPECHSNCHSFRPFIPDLAPLAITVCQVQPLTPLIFSHATCTRKGMIRRHRWMRF